MSAARDGIFLGGIGSDIFGEHNVARPGRSDRVNDLLRNKYLREYLLWHKENHHFHADFESDVRRMKWLRWQTWIMSGSAVVFAAVFINPNFTQRRSYYMRKIVPFMSGLVAYQYGYRLENIAMTNMLLQMNEYLPLEVKRTMQTKDFRHVATFDYRNPGRQLFDTKTGKSLS